MKPSMGYWSVVRGVAFWLVVYAVTGDPWRYWWAILAALAIMEWFAVPWIGSLLRRREI